MSDEENINQPTDDSPPPIGERNTVAETTNNQLQTANMEVHHHPHSDPDSHCEKILKNIFWGINQ
jgi:hypothetical protein